jgi:hypothetical protein
VVKKLLFITAFFALALFGQDARPHPRWTLKTKTGTKILVFVPRGTIHVSDAFRKLLDTVKSLVVVRDDADSLSDINSPLIRQRIVQIHKELDALCKKNDYTCPEVAPTEKLSDDAALVAVRLAAILAINFTTNLNRVYVGHPEREVAEMHRQILEVCGNDCLSRGKRR